MPWFWPIGRPNTTRSPAYRAARASATRPRPTASAAIRMRSGFMPCRMYWKPLPSSPMRSSSGTFSPSMNSMFERRGPRQDQHLLGNLRSRGPDLAAGDDVAVAVLDRSRLDPRRVEPDIGLGDRETGLFPAGDQRRQKPLSLLVG